MSNWIWLPSDKYSENQKTFFNPLGSFRQGKYTVCKLTKKYKFDNVPVRVELVFSADTAFLLTCNGKDIARGPAYSGGDFLGNNEARKDYYSFEVELTPDKPYLDFMAMVRLSPYHICEYSRGQGGFMLFGTAFFENGRTITFSSDDSWDVSLLNSYTSPRFFDNSVKKEPTIRAEIKDDIWNAEIAPIPPCTLKNFATHSFKVGALANLSQRIEYERVFAGYIKIKARTSGILKLKLSAFELDTPHFTYECTFAESDTYCGLELLSVGGFDIEIINEGENESVVEVIFDTSFFPIENQAKTIVSDKELNALLDICAHTLKYCRQSHHLDSPKHCEPLACVGDYYIEMLMTAFSYGDMRLCKFDIERIAETMESNDGRLFHTTYSLIWVNMLYECYMLSGNMDLLLKCEKALSLLFKRFEGYLGENGLVETPPDYMFIDWLFPDGISTHHPPKALGQSCLNMFLFGALNSGTKIYEALGNQERANELKSQAVELKNAILTHLYDKDSSLFFEGLNTKTPDELLYEYMPQNVEKRYYRRHANILACYFGILEKTECKALLERIYNDSSLGEVQPYFMHFWLEAVLRNSVSNKYTLPLLDLWKESIRKCPKGLVEGFYPPEPGYKFDYSHAWGGTPLYSLPMALCGLEILEAGFKKIRLSPSLLSLDFAKVEIPTPYGNILVEISEENGTRITSPKEITIVD
ncbi:MAG: hypothetical protein IJ437_04690 [Clostridia bacterium]|nr:hypothetical protein [Clostridia bacterium]